MTEENKEEGGVTEIKVGEETLSVEQISQMVEENSQLKAGAESVEKMQEFATRYRLTPEQLIEEASGAFELTSNLIEQGVINNEGKVVRNLGPVDPPITDPPPSSEDKGILTNEMVEELFEKKLNPFVEEIKTLKADNNRLLSAALQNELVKRHPEITNDQVAKAVTLASKDRKKTVLQHAEDVIKETHDYRTEIEKEFAKKHGLDLNQLNEQNGDAEAGALFQGKKMSFKAKGDGSVSPLEASKRFLNIANRGKGK